MYPMRKEISRGDRRHRVLDRCVRITYVLGFLGVLALVGCGKATYRLSDGQTVACLESMVRDCGVTLSRCDDGNVYQCQTNFTEE